jgi:RNA polymerase sigma factor for flagellar operon FliA
MDTPDTETKMIEEFVSTHDPALREGLILRYLPLVHYVVGRLGISQWNSSEYSDLVSQGILGLIEAVDRFDPAFGTRLSTYATFKIRSKVLDYLRDLDWLPRSTRQRVRAVQDAMSVLEGTLHRLPSDEELASFMNIEIESLQKTLVDSSRVVVSLDEEIKDAVEGTVPMYEKLPDGQQPDPSDSFNDRDQRQEMIRAIKSLPEREQLILSLYYFEELTFKEIGRTLGISESRVCQVHGRAMISLKTALTGDDSLPVAKSPTYVNNENQSASFPNVSFMR